MSRQGWCILRNAEFRKRVICRIVSAEKRLALGVICEKNFAENVMTPATATINALLKLKTVDNDCLQQRQRTATSDDDENTTTDDEDARTTFTA